MFPKSILLAWIFALPCFATTDGVPNPCPVVVAGLIGPSTLIGESRKLSRVKQVIDRIAPGHIPILITGETGTGKEVVANSIYLRGGSKGPFVVVNVAVLPESLADAMLFGSEKGSYTGSTKRQIGYFEAADNGTVFLDEIGEMPLPLQAKLLRVLDNYGFTRVGGTELVKPNFRLICATNRNLADMVRQKLFREDLFYRLQALSIQLPPLRERLEDIPALAEHLLTQISRSEPSAGVAESFSAEAIAKLQAQNWPGNIRELRTAVIRGYLMAQTPEIQPSDLELGAEASSPHQELLATIDSALSRGDTAGMQEAIRRLDAIRIETAVRQTGDLTQAAVVLGITVPALKRLLTAYKIKP